MLWNTCCTSSFSSNKSKSLITCVESSALIFFVVNGILCSSEFWISTPNSSNYSITSNVRELEGALISLLAQSSLNKKEITIDLAKDMLDKFVRNTVREVSIDYIQKVVCDYFDIPIDVMKSKTRKREIVQCRQLSMYFAKQMTKSSLAMIGKHCGNKDHATVLHACKTVNNLADTDKRFKGYISDIEKRLTLT